MKLRIPTIFLLLLTASMGFAQVPAEQESKPPVKSNPRPAEKQQKKEPYDDASVQDMAKCVLFDTAQGLIELEMFPETAPNTVRNFLNIVEIGALNNTTFDRVVPGFVIQGGNLWSNSAITYEMKIRALVTIPDEPNLVRHERGIISMAKTEDPDSASTNFFILVSSATTLDNKYAAFGKVVTGMDIVDAINNMAVEGETPKEPVLIKTATVTPCAE